MKNKNKIIVLISGVLVILLMVVSVSFAIFRFGTDSTNQELVLGDIWMKYEESNGISLENALPGDEYTNYFEFTITGTNTYTKKDIYYDISLTHGDIPAGKEESNRVEDKYLKFKLTEVNGDTETEIFVNNTYSNLTNKRVHVDTISKSTSTYSKTYRLYMVISEELTYGNSADAILTTEEFGKIFGSVKVNVTGDFNEKEVGSGLTLAESIMAKGVADGVTSEADYGRIVYSGTDVKNYIYFNCNDSDGTYNYGDINYDYQNNCETWRIIGVYTEDGENVVKIVRNTTLTTAELPETYVVDGTTYTIESGTTAEVYWNKPDTLKSVNYSDWGTAGLQYFLNTESDDNGNSGYFGTLATNAKDLIRQTKYRLGNVDNGYDATPNSVYSDESGTIICDPDVVSNSHDNNCNIWSGNQKTLSEKIGLLYPSDFGFSTEIFNSGSWVMKFADYERYSIYSSSWIGNLISSNEWLLSPTSSSNSKVLCLDNVGSIYSNETTQTAKVRPVLYIKSNTKILKGDGTASLPYVAVEY